jgi:hypothetical protein
MDQLAQAAIVTTVGHGLNKRLFDAAAKSAAWLASVPERQPSQRRKDAFSTNAADLACDAVHSGEALPTDGQARNLDERIAAKTAVRGKQNRKKTFGNPSGKTSNPRFRVFRSNTRPCHCGFGLVSPNSVSTTAEDGLRDTRKNDTRRNGTLARCLLAR